MLSLVLRRQRHALFTFANFSHSGHSIHFNYSITKEVNTFDDPSQTETVDCTIKTS